MTFVIWSQTKETYIFSLSAVTTVAGFRHARERALRWKDLNMTSRVGSWLMGVGALGMLMGLGCLASALGDNPDTGLLGLGASLFSFGAMMIAGGLYAKARALQTETASAPPATKKRVRGGCELCGSEAPVVQCKVHQLQLCGTCLADHYDLRSCVYVPAVRKPAGKPGKAMAARARGI